MNILVTGGAGYIGSHCCKALKKNGFHPVVFDSFHRGNSWAVKWGPVVSGHMHETERLIKTIKDYEINAVMHMAALAYVGESVEKPLEYYENNVGGMVSLLRAMEQTNVYRLVFSSSCAVYGEHSNPISEQNQCNPTNPYGQSKLICEQLLKDIASTDLRWRLIALRYFNACGADHELEIGEAHDPETHLIPLCIEAAVNGTELKVFGNKFATRDGTCVRDYLHVEDLSQAHLLALERTQKSNQTYSYFNLGIGSGFSVNEVVKSVERVSGKKIKIKVMDPRPGDPPTLVADNNKAKLELGWVPKWVQLDEMIRTAFEWWLKSKAHTSR
jgi:UDP-arabinose 4-epimerase